MTYDEQQFFLCVFAIYLFLVRCQSSAYFLIEIALLFGLFLNNALFLPEVRQRLRALQYLGYYDAYRSLYPVDSGYTCWDYSGAALTNDMGMRIDYFWMNALAFDRLTDIVVNKKTRIDNKPSDHTVLQAILK